MWEQVRRKAKSNGRRPRMSSEMQPDVLRLRGSLLLQRAPLAVECFLFLGVFFRVSASWDSFPFSVSGLG